MHWPLAFKKTSDYKTLTHEDGKVSKSGNIFSTVCMLTYLHQRQPVVDEELSTNHEPTWRAMEALVRKGKTKAIGVSNFRIDQLENLLKFAEIKPACNQVEAHPWFPQTALFNFCRDNGIVLIAYSPLGSQEGGLHVVKAKLLEDETITAVAKKLGLQPAQVLIAWGSE